MAGEPHAAMPQLQREGAAHRRLQSHDVLRLRPALLLHLRPGLVRLSFHASIMRR